MLSDKGEKMDLDDSSIDSHFEMQDKIFTFLSRGVDDQVWNSNGKPKKKDLKPFNDSFKILPNYDESFQEIVNGPDIPSLHWEP